MDITIDNRQTGRLVTQHWRVCVGGGRVGEALRADFQKHLEMAQRDFPFQYIRMHGLFHEDMMVYREENGEPIVNWQYVDLVFDHWLSIGIRPFVEFGFMPYDMASGEDTVFWWRGNITPPRDWARWEWLIEGFLNHVVERYGLAEVRKWYFEVWNEPNLDVFWKDADYAVYLELYERTARAVKKVDTGLRVGGPATTGSGDHPGRMPWAKEFLQVCSDRGLPIDFYSTHPYPTLHPVDPDGRGYMVWAGPDRLLTDLEGSAATLHASPFPNLERHFTEWSSSPSPRDPVHDTAFMASFLVENNLKVCGLADSLSFWTISDIFEENRIGDTPFHGGFGLVNIQGLKKASYHGYWFLSRLGEEILTQGEAHIVTRRQDGSLAVLLWNYCHYRDDANDSRLLAAAKPGEIYALFEAPPPREFSVGLSGMGAAVRVQTTRFDREHGCVYDAWAAMGAPTHILPSDLAALRQCMELDVGVQRIALAAAGQALRISVQPFGVTLLEISPVSGDSI